MMTVIEMAREAGGMDGWGIKSKPSDPELSSDTFVLDTEDLERFAALVAAAERERICKAIKEEDDYCVTEGDYMLDSDDCIAVAKNNWVRPDYAVNAIRARGETK